ncbi:MAG: phage major capsid domain-containing protein, partial [Candidatus Fonsibacter sp.]
MNRPTGTAYYHKPRGSWKVNKVYANPGAPRVPQIDDTVVYVEFDVTEPLLISPFVVGSGYGKQGFYGIQAMQSHDGSDGQREPPGDAPPSQAQMVTLQKRQQPWWDSRTHGCSSTSSSRARRTCWS